MAYRSSSANNGNGSSGTVPVPASAATDDIAIVALNIDGTGHGTITVTDFTQLDSTITVATPDGHTQAIFYKRLTAADSGNYAFSWTNSNDWIAECALFSGRNTTNPPVASTGATNSSSNTSPVSVGANGVTALTDDDLIWIGGLDGSGLAVSAGCAPPTDFTERQDVNDTTRAWCNLSIATRDAVAAGATGTITGTYTMDGGTAGWLAFLVRIPVVSAGVTSTDASAAGAGAATGIGTSRVAVPGSSAAAGTATATGTSSVSTAASSAGVATATASVTVLISAAGFSASVATADAPVEAFIFTAASSSGGATAEAVGASRSTADATAASVAAADAVGASTARADATAAASSDAVAVGSGMASTNASSDGTATAIAVGEDVNDPGDDGEGGDVSPLIWRRRKEMRRAA